MSITVGFQSLIPFPTIGQHHRTGGDNLADKSKQTVSADIWNLPKTYTSETFWFINLYSHNHNSLFFYLSADQSFFFSTDISFINLDMTMEQIPLRINHRTTQLVEPAPCGFITAKAEDPLQAQGIATKLLTRYIPHCQKPHTQGFTCTLKYRTGRYRSLSLTSGTTNLSPRREPSFCRSTRRANKSFRPTQTQQICSTSGFIRKPFIKFLHRSRIINAANRVSWKNWGVHSPTIQLRERSEYPIFQVYA